MSEPKSCFNCKHGVVDWAGDRSVGIFPPVLDGCNHDGNADLDSDTLDIETPVCQHYDPVMVEKCKHCGDVINQPQYSWELWSPGWFDSLPACSQDCVDALNKAIQDTFL